MNLTKAIPQVCPKQDQVYIQALINHIDFVIQNFNGYSKHFDDWPNESFINFKSVKASYAAHSILLALGN